MYCIKCGVELSDGERRCPLCKTEVFHPEFLNKKKEDPYPVGRHPEAEKQTKVFQILLTAAFVLALVIVMLCDIQVNRAVSWSGYVAGALALGYVIFALPLWFRRPNPVIFVPCSFGACAVYLLYIELVHGGSWFWLFGLPVTGCIGIIITCVVTLMRYVPKGAYYIFGGASLAMGAFMLLCELLMTVTFEGVRFVGWSLYPLVTLVILGGLLIFLGICRPAREAVKRKLFI
ncbi:MAG: hypothetical protein IJD22_04085 [Clostridia bacterium]|nr:hypothetical protein [Clostridia bacterium]